MKTATLAVVAVWTALSATGCLNLGAFDLSPKDPGKPVVVPAVWRGDSPFVEAQPADDAIRGDWWAMFKDPVLTALVERALRESPDLAAAQERYLQARDEMMKSRAKFVPRLGAGAEATANKQSAGALFRAPGESDFESDVRLGGEASWELDFWGGLRNRTRQRLLAAQERAAAYALARLSLQAELASAYFTLRSIDAQDAIYRQSIAYYEQSLALVTVKFKGLIAADLDVARAKYQLASTQARHLGIQAQRQVVEHAIAVMVNAVPLGFRVAPLDAQATVAVMVPGQLPSALLQRRPDIAAAQRKVAQANRGIGVARAAFFPSIPLVADGGIGGHADNVFKVPNFFWSVGGFLRLPVFDGGRRRAELQRAWSVWREMELAYRAVVLNAFREVEDGLSLTHFAAQEVARQEEAVTAAWRQQTLSMELYKGGLASSLELINAQVNTLEARLMATEVKANLARSAVALVRAMGGGWAATSLPSDDDVQPFGTLRYIHIDPPEPADTAVWQDLTRQASF